MKGFSAIVEEALEEYLRRDDAAVELLRQAIEAKGALTEQDARELEKISIALRNRWR